MNFFGAVVVLVALLFILFRMFRESVKSSAVQNAFLAKYTYDQLTKDQQRQVHDQTLQKIRAGWPGPIENMPDFTAFNRMGLPPEMAEMIKFSFYGSTMAELGIEPSLAGEKWHYVRRPFLAFHGAEHQVRVIRYHFQHTHKVNIDFTSSEDGHNLNFAMPVERKTEWANRTIALIKLKDWQGLLDWCWKWTKSEPKNAKAWASLSIAYGNLGRYDDVIEAYQQALRIDSKEAQEANAWSNPGAYGELDRYDDAIEAYLQALRINPKNSKTWVSLGLVYSDLNRYDDAIDACHQALRIDPKEANALSNLGVTYGDLKRYDDAIEAYRQALLIDPEDAKAGMALGSFTATSIATTTPSKPTTRHCALIRKKPMPGPTSGLLMATSSATTTPSKSTARPCVSIRSMPMPGSTSGSLTTFSTTGLPPWVPSRNCDASIRQKPTSYSI